MKAESFKSKNDDSNHDRNQSLGQTEKNVLNF